jgi:hypothetical protein
MAGGLDHIVVLARDLDALAETYKRLGFTVGARNVHPWLTMNNIVQFPGCFLELVSTAPDFVRPAPDAPEANFALGAARFLDDREGIGMMVLESHDAKSDLENFRAKGIGKGEVFWFGRAGRRPDGSEVKVAFSVVFADSPFEGLEFFVCEQHHPENFWNPSFQEHPNAVTGIEAIVMRSANPDAAMDFLLKYSGRPASTPIIGGRGIQTDRGRIEVLTEAGLRALVGNAAPDLDKDPAFAALRFASSDLAATRAALEAGKVPYVELNGRLIVPAKAALGAALVFEKAH